MKQHKVIDRDTFIDPRPIAEIENEIVERLKITKTNPLGWRPIGRDADGYAVIGCTIGGKLHWARITNRGIMHGKEPIRVESD